MKIAKDYKATPAEKALLERQEERLKKEWEEYLKTKGKKPDWMPDENSSHKEWLEFYAYTVPFKNQQMIDILEGQANKLSDFANDVFSDKPEERERWLHMAEDLRQQAQRMRANKHLYRITSEQAKEELGQL